MGKYVYINCTQFDEKEARQIVKVLEEIGIEVCLDEDIFEGIFWSGKRWELIKKCCLAIELECSGSEYVSLPHDLAHYCLGRLEIPRVVIDSKEKYYKLLSPPKLGFRGSVWDEDIKCKLESALICAGWPDSVKSPDCNEIKYDDFGVRFFSKYGVKGQPFYHRYYKFLNLRTHEVFDYNFNRMKRKNGEQYILSDTEVYQAATWLFDDYVFISKNETVDYEETEADRYFLKELDARMGEPPKYLEERYEGGSVYEFPEGYPYMDEFEYIDSDDK